ncbi:MAG: transglycosylase SLT domain-containing protein, partial [Thermaerobacter sp.]|nr:transglycosylase SLT domain-containing protein [Thermaerobacter sp.]
TPEWILVSAGAPTGAPWTLEWRAPTVKYVQKTKTEQVPVTVTKKVKVLIPHTKPKRYRTVTKKITKIVTRTVTYTVREVIDHNLTGRALEEPVSVYATMTNGKTQPLAFSGAKNSPVPAWPGEALWGGQFDLAHVAKITAVWPGIPPITETIPWPPARGQAMGHVASIPITGAVKYWWTAIQAASTRTGVPPGLIAAIMLHESGGNPNAFNALGPAYGLMQILNTTAPGLPAYAAGWQTNGPLNLLMGAQVLQADYQAAGSVSWRAAIAAYYGGLGTMEQLGYRPGMSWSQAAPLLNAVPGASSGNTVTMTAYADQMHATAQKIMASHP